MVISTLKVKVMINWTLQVNILSILDIIQSVSAENPTHVGLRLLHNVPSPMVPFNVTEDFVSILPNF